MVAAVLAPSSLDSSLSPLWLLLGITQSQDISCPPESPSPGVGWEAACAGKCLKAENMAAVGLKTGRYGQVLAKWG